MKRVIAIALLSCMPFVAPAYAVDQADAFKLCVNKLASQFGVDRNAMKKFNIRLVEGEHYEIYGTDGDNRHISCNVINGLVKGIKIG